ncbi:UNVERIFIED_CONTAM: hypothetical protein K2H54_053979 [Gekko kuhli]
MGRGFPQAGKATNAAIIRAERSEALEPFSSHGLGQASAEHATLSVADFHCVGLQAAGSFSGQHEDIEAMEDVKVALVDAPVVALHSGAILSKDGDNVLKDPVNRKNKTALKKSHEAASLAVRASAVPSSFTRAIVIWANNLLQEMDPDRVVLKGSFLKIKIAAEFGSDASQNTMQFCARAEAAKVVIR